MASDIMLTTVDNPFSPFTEYEEWNRFDLAAGHHTNALLGRILVSSDDLSPADQEVAIEEAIYEIVKLNVSGVHVIAHGANA